MPPEAAEALQRAQKGDSKLDATLAKGSTK
jgi:hypothetical protein